MQFTEEALFATIGRQALAIDRLNQQVAELRAQLHEAIRAKETKPAASETAAHNGEVKSHA
jgi:hypothetical protein